MGAVIYLLRHGQTAMNRRMALQGRSDLPLNETGIAQARAVGQWFRQEGIAFRRVYSSPLGRAMETAALAAGDVPVLRDDRLLEMDYGPYEGADLRTPDPALQEFFRDLVHNPAPAGMEPLDQVVRRLGAFLESLRGEEGNLLISTHAIAMKGALEYLTPESHGSYWAKNIGNCAVYRTELTDEGFTVPEEVLTDI